MSQFISSQQLILLIGFISIWPIGGLLDGSCPTAGEVEILHQPIDFYDGIWYEIYTHPNKVDACPCHYVNNTVIKKRGRNFMKQGHFCYNWAEDAFLPYSTWEYEELNEGVGAFVARRVTSYNIFNKRHNFFVMDWDDLDTYVGLACDPGLFLSRRSFRIFSRSRTLQARTRSKFASFLEEQGADWYRTVYASPNNWERCPRDRKSNEV
ncbi:uncharacterized protein LOC134842765 [Symsagittifera roscoffensis]|uniref:uncharacterized protein LOC134842765 n=1 Tax=Symsagittifera roscoffensis TaxID=84072 RepID=UPI00307C281D